MDIEIYHMIEGAKQADGLAVIIDVFRAFSMECYLYAAGAGEVRPVGTVGETFAWKERDPGCVLVGERHGKRIDGCDLGNSPSTIRPRLSRSTSGGSRRKRSRWYAWGRKAWRRRRRTNCVQFT